MKSRTLPLFPIIALILITLSFSLPGQGESLFGNPLEFLSKAQQVADRYSENIKLSESTVNAIIEDDVTGIIRPEGAPEGQSANERVKDLKVGIKGELAKAKANQLALELANKQLAAALDRYTKNPTPDNFKNAQGIANQINSYRDKLNGNFEIIKGMLIQISKIRRNVDEKEWDNPDGKYKDERAAVDQLWNSLKVVPNVVDLTYQRAVETLAEAGLTVDSVVVKRAPSQDLSEKVTRQEPKAGELIPPGKTAKLWHYDRFGGAAPPVTPPATGAQGFQKGDAGKIDARFGAFSEIISPDRRNIHLKTNVGLGWGIMKCASRADALEKIKQNQGMLNVKNYSESYGEAIVKERIHTPGEILIWWTSRGFYGNPPHASTHFALVKLHRELFIIGYSEHAKQFDANLPAKWPSIYENSKKLIDERFPPEPLAMDAWPAARHGGPDLACKAGEH